jgi:hypothetical protein
VLPPTAHPCGQSYGEWAADWWQWALEQPAATNPLLDETGARCANGQQGKVWFLAGTRTSDHPGYPQLHGAHGHGAAVPGGQRVLLRRPWGSDPYRRGPSRAGGVRQATGLTATIDGTTVPNVNAYFEESARFSVTLPEDNVFGGPPSAPGGLYKPCVDAGYYLLVRPPPPASTPSTSRGRWLLGRRRASSTST